MKFSWKSILLFIASFLFVFLIFPTKGLAVDYSISDVNITANLLEDGNVHVKEQFTYEFDGNFNGILREIVPKQGTSITNFSAEENGQPLIVEQEDHMYKIHRKGKDETIVVLLTYTIEKGIDVYEDVGEFYWPFFDKRNESTYENFTVTVNPPRETREVIAFGYDEAFETETINKDGTVIFHFGKVPDGKNGDIRVAYNANLFPNAPVNNGIKMKDMILDEKEQLINDKLAKLEMKERVSKIAKTIIPIFFILSLIIMTKAFVQRRNVETEIKNRLSTHSIIPKEKISLPATIMLTNPHVQPTSLLSAAFLNLMRKGYVKNIDKSTFTMNETNKPTTEHELFLLGFLFREIGTNKTFQFDDLKKYTKKKSNHTKYSSMVHEWMKLVRQEVKDGNFYNYHKFSRIVVALMSVLLAPLLVLLPMYDVPVWFIVTLILFIYQVGFALFYKTKNKDGLEIIYEWKNFKRAFEQMKHADELSLSQDDLLKVYIFGIGLEDETFIKRNKHLIESFRPTEPTPDLKHSTDPILLYGGFALLHFHTADEQIHASTSSSTSSPSSWGGGGGVGGGGGGSGAF